MICFVWNLGPYKVSWDVLTSPTFQSFQHLSFGLAERLSIFSKWLPWGLNFWTLAKNSQLRKTTNKRLPRSRWFGWLVLYQTSWCLPAKPCRALAKVGEKIHLSRRVRPLLILVRVGTPLTIPLHLQREHWAYLAPIARWDRLGGLQN